MELITVMNYSEKQNESTMCLVWLHQAMKAVKRSLHVDSIVILWEKENKIIRKFVDTYVNSGRIRIETKQRHSLQRVPHPRWNHNVGFKLYHLCQRKKPYIFLDADAILQDTANLDVLWEASQQQPWIAVDHQTIPNHTSQFKFRFINTGCMVVGDPKWMNFDRIWNTKQIWKVPGTDQYLLNNYVKNEKYDYHHPNVSYGWNACGGYKRRLSDGSIVSHRLQEKHPIYVLHYWDEFKPWNKRCEIYDAQKRTFINELKDMIQLREVNIHPKVQLAKEVIHDILMEYQGKKTLVFGLGYDSDMWWSHNKNNVYFIEQNKDYIKLNPMIPKSHMFHYTYPGLSIQKSMQNPESFEIESPEWLVKNGPYDVILIDGPTGYNVNQPGRQQAIYWATKYLSKKGTIIYVDDAKRPVESKFIGRYCLQTTKTMFHSRNGCVKYIVK